MDPWGNVRGIVGYTIVRHDWIEGPRQIKKPDALQASLDHAWDILRHNECSTLCFRAVLAVGQRSWLLHCCQMGSGPLLRTILRIKKHVLAPGGVECLRVDWSRVSRSFQHMPSFGDDFAQDPITLEIAIVTEFSRSSRPTSSGSSGYDLDLHSTKHYRIEQWTDDESSKQG